MESEDSNYMDCVEFIDKDDADSSIYTIDYKIGEDGSDCLIHPIDENIFMDEDLDSEEENILFNDEEIATHSNTSGISTNESILTDMPKVTKKMQADINRQNRLEKKREKRRNYEYQLKLRKLKLSPDDIRRTMMQTYMTLYGNRDFKSLKLFLDKNALPHFLARFETIFSDDKSLEEYKYILPRKIEIRGVDNVLNLCRSVGQSLPDSLLIFNHIFVRASLKKSRKGHGKEVKLADISDKTGGFLDLSNQKWNPLEQEKYHFENSIEVRQDIRTFSGTGFAIFHLDHNHKIHLFERTYKFNSYTKFPITRQTIPRK